MKLAFLFQFISLWNTFIMHSCDLGRVVGRTNVNVSQMRYLSRLTTKPTKWHVRPAKTQISLGIRPVWSVFAVRSTGS